MPLVLPAHKIKISYSLSRSNYLTTWDKSFLGEIEKASVLSDKYLLKLNDIYEDIRFKGTRKAIETWVDDTWADRSIDNFDRTWT